MELLALVVMIQRVKYLICDTLLIVRKEERLGLKLK